jgi:hypothetical protein
MRVTITDRLVGRTAQKGAAIPFAVKVYTDTSEPWVLVTPTTLRYRIDDPEYGDEIVGWTTVTPASSATITVTGAQNTISGGEAREKRRLTVQADDGLSTSCIEVREWYVLNGFPL